MFNLCGAITRMFCGGVLRTFPPYLIDVLEELWELKKWTAVYSQEPWIYLPFIATHGWSTIVHQSVLWSYKITPDLIPKWLSTLDPLGQKITDWQLSEMKTFLLWSCSPCSETIILRLLNHKKSGYCTERERGSRCRYNPGMEKGIFLVCYSGSGIEIRSQPMGFGGRVLHLKWKWSKYSKRKNQELGKALN